MKMTAMRIALEDMNVKPILRVDKEPDGNDDIWFRHCSPLKLNKLIPLNYKELAEARPGYNMEWRRNTEDKYHEIFARNNLASHDCTFLYATICGYHRMGPPEDYDGYTYYFRLTKDQIDSTLFEIIDAEHRREASRGVNAMLSCTLEWDRNKDKYTSYHEENLGDVHPRIEVIIPFEVLPELYFPPKKER